MLHKHHLQSSNNHDIFSPSFLHRKLDFIRNAMFHSHFRSLPYATIGSRNLERKLQLQYPSRSFRVRSMSSPPLISNILNHANTRLNYCYRVRQCVHEVVAPLRHFAERSREKQSSTFVTESQFYCKILHFGRLLVYVTGIYAGHFHDRMSLFSSFGPIHTNRNVFLDTIRSRARHRVCVLWVVFSAPCARCSCTSQGCLKKNPWIFVSWSARLPWLLHDLSLH